MVAQLAAMHAPLPLLVEPLPPHPEATKATGWRMISRFDGRRLVRERVRDRHDDEMGAFVQHVIVRYRVHGVQRRQIAQEAGYSERQIQTWLLGRGYKPYTLAVLAALKDLGISPHRGIRNQDRESRAGRLGEIIAAQAGLLSQTAERLASSTDPTARRIVAASRLLMAGREPVRAP